MRRPELLPILLVLVASVSCDDAPEPRPYTAEPGHEAHFAAFARDLFAALRNEPLDSAIEAEVGLFGDLSVDSGERAVMGRYRYRVDSSDAGPVAHMAFQVRDESRQDAPVPVVLTFETADNTWRLERAVFGAAVSETAGNARDHAVHQEPDESEGSEMGQLETPLHESLQAHLDAWLETAIMRMNDA